MGIHRSQDDSWTKEMQRWEQRDVIISGTPVMAIDVAEGGRKNAPFSAYDKMLYRAEMADGGPQISATKIVKNEAEELIAVGQGWSVTQQDAIDAVHARHREMARAAAERAATERWMSPKAQAEAAAVDESTMQHVPVIPETPLKPRPRKE